MREPEMDAIAELIRRALAAVGDDDALARIGNEVRELCRRFPFYRHRLA
jgi:glycine/serine hydroxymethyltransferase